MQTHEIVFNLNKALEWEYSDVFLYPREAKLIKDKNEVISSLFEEFGLMEVRHADILSIRILELGGKPTWEFKLLSEFSDLKEILMRHLNREEATINFYQNLIDQIDDHEIKILLRGIRAEEQVHLDKIKGLL